MENAAENNIRHCHKRPYNAWDSRYKTIFHREKQPRIGEDSALGLLRFVYGFSVAASLSRRVNCRVCHHDCPKRHHGFAAGGFVNFGELAFIQPETAAFWALGDFHPHYFGGYFSVEPLVRTTRAKARFRRGNLRPGMAPYRQKRDGCPRVHVLQFPLFKPNAAAASVTDIEPHPGDGLRTQQPFARGTLHKSRRAAVP